MFKPMAMLCVVSITKRGNSLHEKTTNMLVVGFCPLQMLCFVVTSNKDVGPGIKGFLKDR